jgi:hypothetical protein
MSHDIVCDCRTPYCRRNTSASFLCKWWLRRKLVLHRVVPEAWLHRHQVVAASFLCKWWIRSTSAATATIATICLCSDLTRRDDLLVMMRLVNVVTTLATLATLARRVGP